MLKINQTLTKIISDPYVGPYEGEDFWIEADGTIQVPNNNIVMAATIMRKANGSGKFKEKLVKVGTQGDSILLGFDTLGTVVPVHTAKIGYAKDTLAEVKTDQTKFYLYVNGKRQPKIYNRLSAAKTAVNKLDLSLKQAGEIPEENLED